MNNNRLFSIGIILMLVLSGIVFFGSEKSEATNKNIQITVTVDYIKVLDDTEPVFDDDEEVYLRCSFWDNADWQNADSGSPSTTWQTYYRQSKTVNHAMSYSKTFVLTTGNECIDLLIKLYEYDASDSLLDISPHSASDPDDKYYLRCHYYPVSNEYKYWVSGSWAAPNWSPLQTGWSVVSGEMAPDTQNAQTDEDAEIRFKIEDNFNYVKPSTPSPTGNSNWQKLPVTFTWPEPTVSNSQCNIDHYTWKIDSGQTQNTPDRTVTINTGITSGTHTFNVMTVDDIGGESAYGSFTFKIDETSPTQPGTVTAPVGWTNDNTPDFSWVAATDSHSGVDGYSYMVDNPPDNSKDTESIGCTIAQVSDGTHTFYVKAMDKLGNWGDSTQITFNVDATPPNMPTITSSSHSDENTWYSNNNPSFTWSQEGGPSPVTYYYALDNADPTTSIDTNAISVSDVVDGVHILYVKALDTGGSSNIASYNIKVDTTPPLKPTELVVIPTEWTNINSFSVSWTDPTETDNSNIKSGAYYYIEDSQPSESDGKWLGGKPITITDAPEGEHTLYLWLEDEVGNTNKDNFRSTLIRIDTKAPHDLSMIINNEKSVTSSLSVPLTLSAMDDTAGLFQMCFSNNGLIWSDWEEWSEYKSWDLTIAGGDDEAGTKTIYCKVKDIAGNEIQTSGTIEYDPNAEDNVPPEVTTKAPTGRCKSETPTIEATFSDPNGIDISSIVLMLDDTDVTDNAIITSSSITYEVTTKLSKGEHIVELTIADNSPNKNVGLVSWSFTIGGEGPIIIECVPNGMIVEKKPKISASYSADAGIDTTSVIVRFDGNDITDDCIIDPKGFSYTVKTPLSEKNYQVYLKVADNKGIEASNTWSFTIIGSDIFPPEVFNFKPTNGERVKNDQPIISASYSDSTTGGSQIDTKSVLIKLDDNDITKDCDIKTDGFTYTPSAILLYGKHTVEVKVSDVLNNMAQKSWEFTIVDMVSPELVLVSPTTEVNTKEVLIEISYTDANTGNSDIDTSSIVLKMDNKDVTGSSTITSSKISYTVKNLINGEHKISIAVQDKEGNKATKEWSFIVSVKDSDGTDGGIFGGSSSTIIIVVAIVFLMLIIGLILIIIRKKGKKAKSLKKKNAATGRVNSHHSRPSLQHNQQITVSQLQTPPSQHPSNNKLPPRPPRPPRISNEPSQQTGALPQTSGQPILPPSPPQQEKTDEKTKEQLRKLFDLNKPTSQPPSNSPPNLPNVSLEGAPQHELKTLTPFPNTPSEPQDQKQIDFSQISMCPYCGKGLNFPKAPKFCPYCKEQISM